MARAATQQSAPRAETPHDPQIGEVMPPETTAVAVREFGQPDADFEVVKHVSVPMLSEREAPPGVAITCRFVDARRVMPPLEGYKSKFPGDFICSTIAAPNGSVRLFPWSTVFRQEMDRDYANDGYVGKWFQITRLPMKRGKNYWTFAITEVRPRQLAA